MKVIKNPEWTEEQFAEAEVLVSGIEYSTMMTAGDPVPLETRIKGALNIILDIFGIPEDIRRNKIGKVFAMDYRSIGKQVIADFNEYVKETNDRAFLDLVKR